MAKLTGVPATTPGVLQTYNAVQQAMPVNTNLGGFVSSQQMGVTQLAIQYCSALVDDTSARASFFPGFNFAADPAAAFADRSLVLTPLNERLLGVNINTQPSTAGVDTDINSLIDDLMTCGGGACEADRTERIVKAACATVLGSASMLVQ